MPLIFGNSNLPIDTKTLSINTLFPHQKDEWLWFGVFAVRHLVSTFEASSQHARPTCNISWHAWFDTHYLLLGFTGCLPTPATPCRLWGSPFLLLGQFRITVCPQTCRFRVKRLAFLLAPADISFRDSLRANISLRSKKYAPFIVTPSST